MARTFKDKLKTDLILLDGAFGTYAHELGLTDACFKDRPGCMEYLTRSRPDLVIRIHCDYLEAGSDAIQTNTFGANSIKLMEYGLSSEVYDINLEAARLARKAADSFSNEKFPRYVVGSMGPTGGLPSSTNPDLAGVSYSELKEVYCEQALGLIDGKVDALLIETGQDLLEMKAAVTGVNKALKERHKDLAILAQCTLIDNGRMLLGTEISAVMTVLAYLGVSVIGINCGAGPLEMEKQIAFLSANSPVFISAVPNAGLPVELDGRAVYPLTPKEMADMTARLVQKYRIDVVGGCCGTNPEHIRAMRQEIKRTKKGRDAINRVSTFFCASSYQGFDLEKKKRPIIIGERINSQGSRGMKKLLEARDYDAIVEIGKNEERLGADILDVCTVLTERPSEKEDTVILTRKLAESVETPLMIDSTDINVIKEALENYPGTAFINSANLEDGGKKARRVFSLAKEHGAFVVNLVIDENGMAKTVQHKLETAEKLYKMAVDECGLEPRRVIFDMLTFTLATGEKEYAGAAVNTFEAIKALKKQCPGALSVLGVSNVSFGLSKSARGVLNMVFLYHAIRAGLDMAIVNPAEIVEYKDIPKIQRDLSEDVIFNKKPDALGRLVEYFAHVETRHCLVSTKNPAAKDKIKQCVFDRDKTRVIPCIDEALKEKKPEDIINNILMPAMREVGEKLDKGEMVLPYVLQSAEVMRQAVEYLGKFLSKEISGKGKMILATVAGDVHDIGKNLVKMVLSNNAFKVIDLGKKVRIEEIVSQARDNKVNAIGLSALLVSTARNMKTCVQALHDAGLRVPVIIGGAPINERFANEVAVLKDGSFYQGGVFYAKDAFSGLRIMQALTDPAAAKKILEEYRGKVSTPLVETRHCLVSTGKNRKATQKKPRGLIKPPLYGVKLIPDIDNEKVFLFLDEDVLFAAWGTKLKDNKEKARIINQEYRPLLKELKKEALADGWLDFKAVYGYFKCRARNENLEIFNKNGVLLENIHFSRSSDGLSLADYFLESEKEYDTAVFQAVTIGGDLADAVENLNSEEQFTRAFFLHGLGSHLAEALAKYTQGKISEELKLKKGTLRRWSPGFPSWKTLEDQEKIFRLLDVENKINVHLTENWQMVPEASTTAMIVAQ
ncbi:MAG: homocysteine S-methyltransferase family protein [Candidatus Omnitrophota bacterium]